MGIFSRSSKHTSERVLFIDIGGTNVSACFADLGAGKPHVTGGVETAILIPREVTFDGLLREMLKALKVTLRGMHALKQAAPSRVMVSLSSPWYVAQIRAARLTRTTDFPVSRGMLDDLIARERRAFEDEELRAMAQGGALRAIESRTLEVKINGYVSDEPLGKIAREVELSLFLSAAHEHVLDAVREMIFDVYPLREVVFSSSLAHTYYVARHFLPHDDQFILADIGGEVTDVSLVDFGALRNTVSFPEGVSTVLRGIALTLGRSGSEASTLFHLYQTGQHGGQAAPALDRKMRALEESWVAAFRRSVSSLVGFSAPGTILVRCPDSAAQWYCGLLSREDLRHFSGGAGEFKIIPLDATLFHGALRYSTDVPRESGLMIAILASDFLHKAKSAH